MQVQVLAAVRTARSPASNRAATAFWMRLPGAAAYECAVTSCQQGMASVGTAADSEQLSAAEDTNFKGYFSMPHCQSRVHTAMAVAVPR